ncbi:hypothetical protein O3S81_12390 [Agrobacterium sp. SOY23]|uniref:hypothetical protein n=1 Tax=Agrobacterium sp. SOY23 TaxID=3014555 RepID=UPI0022AF1314|nr:hypothetical protein [Agrobacterium sp. SOY23]MCZ4430499.1 hypothetical protein [Agrobacterium sp. SOY23]
MAAGQGKEFHTHHHLETTEKVRGDWLPMAREEGKCAFSAIAASVILPLRLQRNRNIKRESWNCSSQETACRSDGWCVPS